MDPLISLFPDPALLDRIARVLGAIGTALTAAFGVYKGIYYADHNLPERFKQFLQRADEKLRGDRKPLLAAIAEPRAGVRVKGSVFFVHPLNLALSQIGYGDLSAADKSLKEAVRQLEVQMDASKRQSQSIEGQKATAHILRGSIASALAEYDSSVLVSADAGREQAEKEFTLALELRPRDIDALELRGRQRELRGNYQGALTDYEMLAEVAKDEGSTLRAVRAYRLQGELLENRATRQSLDEARRRLDAALKLIEGGGSLTHSGIFEKGLLLKAFGRVQKQRNRLPNARTHLEGAASCFALLKTPEASAHGNEVQQMLKELVPEEDFPSLRTDNEKKAESSGFGGFLRWLRRAG